MNNEAMFTDDLEPVSRWSDPVTSHDAARSVGKVRDKQAAVLNVLRNYKHGLTDDSLRMVYPNWHAEVPQSESGLRTRRKELVELGLVEDSGQRVRLPSGRMAVVWRAT